MPDLRQRAVIWSGAYTLGDEVYINDGVIVQSCEGAGENRQSGHYSLTARRIVTGVLDLSTRIDHQRHVVLARDDQGWRVDMCQGNYSSRHYVGEEAVVAAGSLVTQDVEAGTLVFGVPARAIRRFKSTSTGETPCSP